MPKKAICLATNQFEGIDQLGGIGTYYRELSILLSKKGWSVFVLYLPYYSHVSEEELKAFSNSFYEIHGIPVYDARVLCKSIEDQNDIINAYEFMAQSDHHLAQSHILHEAIQILQKKYDLTFDLIEFHEWQGIGAIPVRMKKICTVYENTKLIVKLHSPDAWIRESFFDPSLCQRDVKIDYLNRYSFENADIQVSPTEYLLNWCKFHGWDVRDDASVCRNIISLPKEKIPEVLVKEHIIAFFGRIEERKGLLEFIDSLLYIKRNHPKFQEKYSIAFVGTKGKITNETIKERLSGFNVEFHSFINRDDALDFIKKIPSLVVIPSWQDNFPNTVLECMSLAVPFISSRGGGIPEMLGKDRELYNSISCDVTDPKQLGDLIISYLKNEPETTVRLLSMAHDRLQELVDPDVISRWYEKNVENDVPFNDLPINIGNNESETLVTLSVLVNDQVTERYLETTLQSILMQTYKNMKILIYDTSSDSQALSRFDHLKNKYSDKEITFLHAEASKGVNEMMSHIDTKYLLIVDDRNIAKPEMVDTFVRCMEKQDSIASLSCYYRFFTDEDEATIMNHIIMSNDGIPKISNNSLFSSIGPCIPLIFTENIMGDSNAIYVTEIVKKVGGWPYSKSGYRDWTMRVKLLAYGYHMDVLPEVLFYSRQGPEDEKAKLNLLYVDDVNINYIKKFLKMYPETYSQYYWNIHRLMRCPRQERRKTGDEKSPLILIGKRLGEFADRNPAWKKIFTVSGNFLRKILIKKE